MIKEAIMGVLAGFGGVILLIFGFFMVGTSYGNNYLIAFGFIVMFFGIALLVVARKLIK